MTTRAAAAAMLCAGVVSTAGLAKDNWIGVRTPNLTVISNAGEGDTRQVAERFEQFAFAFTRIFGVKPAADVPLTVMVFRNDSSFAPFKPRYKGRAANVAGYFQRGHDENLIALSLDAPDDSQPFSVIFHEYTHVLTSRAVTAWPIWLQEGLAEFYSTFETDRNRVTIGRPIAPHVFLLRQERLIPLPSLFQVDPDSPIYNERDKQNIFYAQSWALVHYLMLGDKGTHQKALTQFINALEAGVPLDRAFAEAFRTDYKTMEANLQRYVGNDRYPILNVTLDTAVPAMKAAILPVPEAEAEFHQGNLLMRTDRGDEAEPYFNRARKLDPGLARVDEGAGFLAMRRGRYDEATGHFKQAVARDSRNHLAYYYYAEVLHQQFMKAGTSPSPDATRTMSDLLRTSIKLAPAFAPAYQLLGYVHLVTGEQLREGAAWLQTAITLAPQHRESMVMLAAVQLRLGEYAAAKASAQTVIAAADAGAELKAEAQRMVEAADRAAENARRAEAGPIPASRAALNLDGLEKMEGTLTAIDCTSGKPILVLTAADATARFSADPSTLKFYTTDPAMKIAPGCGPINLAATVYYAAGAAGAAIKGNAVVVELRAK